MIAAPSRTNAATQMIERGDQRPPRSKGRADGLGYAAGPGEEESARVLRS